MKELSLREIQQAELDIMTEVDRVARKYGLKYSLFAGTMIGAVRHHGFIPWDDDIDITMPRPDYDRLRELNKNEDIWPEHIRLACFEDGNLNVPFMKIFDTRTHVSEEKIYEEDSQNLWVDIFPLDGLPESWDDKVRLYKKSLFLSKLSVASAVKKGEGSSAAKNIIREIAVKPYVKIFGRRHISEKQKKLGAKIPYGATPECGLAVWGFDGPGQALTIEEYEDLIEMDFEGRKFFVTSSYDKNLTGIFGDYMQLPPENERISHNMEVYMDED